MKRTFWLVLVMAISAAQLPAIHLAMAKDASLVAAQGALVDLNTATAGVLNALPGLSAAKAKAIVDGRPYTSVEDLLTKGVVSKAAFGKLKDLVTVAGGKAAAAAPAVKAADQKGVDDKAVAEKKAKVEKAATAKANGALVDLNSGTADDLKALPGVGAAKAKEIVTGRPYATVDDLLTKGIVSKSAFGKFKDLVKVSANAAVPAAAAAPAETADALPPEPNAPIDLNTASIEELNALPGIGAPTAKAIIAGRPYTSMSDFVGKNIVAKAELAKLKGAIEVVPVSKSAASATPASGLTPGQAAARVRIKQCGAQWQAAKAAGQLPAGQKWPGFWSDCNKRLKANG